MIDKRYLFRGFHPNENGNTTITFNGKKIRGEWRYWNKFGSLVDLNTLEETPYYSKCENYSFPAYFSAMLILIEETIGQWVATDKNGKDLFEKDKFMDYDGNVEIITIEDWYYWIGESLYSCDEIELIGNIFEENNNGNQ